MMQHRRFVPNSTVKAKANMKSPRIWPPGEDRRARRSRKSDPTTPGEVIRFAVRLGLVFAAVICLPAIAARLVHRGAMPDVTAWLHTADAKTNVQVYDTAAKSTSTMPMNTYILDVLSAEFSPGAPMDSLEAAAVATRTYAVHALTETGGTSSVAKKHHADLTDDSQLDLPLATQSDIEAEYPNQAYHFLSRLQAAVEKTDGLIVTYDNKPILAFMFDLSSGRTRSGKAVFGQPIPYLQAIECPDDKVDANRVSVNVFQAREVQQAFASDSMNLNQLHMKRGADGFVITVTYQKRTMSGSDFANLLHLPSSNFTWKIQPDGLAVTTYGRGTDVGMSLHEATVMAKKGIGWEEIISHFYPGTKVRSDTGLVPI